MGKEIRSVGVVGCGLMGSGIAQVAAQAGLTVTVREVDQGFLDRGVAQQALAARRVALGACLWGSGDGARTRPTWARLAIVVGAGGRVVEARATTMSGSAPVERCLEDRSRTLPFPAPEDGPAPLDVWLVAP